MTVQIGRKTERRAYAGRHGRSALRALHAILEERPAQVRTSPKIM